MYVKNPCTEGLPKTAMKPPPFSYHDPKTVSEVVGLLSSLDNAKLLAGGQSLMPMLNFRYVQPDHIIDLNRVEGLAYIRETADGMEVGAMTRQRDLEFSDLVEKRFPLMHEAIACIGHRQTRNRGTIGGSLCHLDPSAELVSCAMTLDATVIAVGPNGPRDIAFKDFPVGYLTSAIEPTELLTAIWFTAWPAGHGYAFREFARRHGDFAIVACAAVARKSGVRLAIGGVTDCPTARDFPDIDGDALDDALDHFASDLEAHDDLHATADYRRALVRRLGRATIEEARRCRA